MSVPENRLSLIVVGILLVSAVAGGVGATTDPGPDPTNETTTTNTTTPHQNPAEIEEAGDEQRVAMYLSSRLGDRLSSSAVSISAEEQDRGRSLLGDDYALLLEQYSSVAGDVGAEETAVRFDLARERQLAVINSTQELDQTAAAYQRAVENGNDEEARALAREIVTITRELNETTNELDQQYTALENETGIDLDEAQQALGENQRRLNRTATTVASREFTEPRLTVATNRTNISATDPVAVSGRLTTANGTAIDNATIRIRLGNDTIRTRTGDNGRFETTYRPLLASVNATDLTVTYVPSGTAPYLSTTKTTRVSITEQTATTIELTETTEAAGFTDPVRATGRVTVAGSPDRQVAGIPLTLTVDGQPLATATTDPDGTATLRTSLPANISLGQVNIQLAIDGDNLAIAPTSATTRLAIRGTPTDVSVDATIDTAENQIVTVSGRLTTESGEPVSGRAVRVSMDETELGTAETDATGRYQSSFSVPGAVAGSEAATVSVVFDPADTNLDSSTATQQVRPSSADIGGALGNLSSADIGGALGNLSSADIGGALDGLRERSTQSRALVLAIGLNVVAILVSGVVFLRRRDGGPAWLRRVRSIVGVSESTESASAAASDMQPNGDTTSHADSPPTGSAPASSEPSPLERAQTALADGRSNTAVRIAYETFRNEFESTDDSSAETHWEFYRRCQDADRSNAETVRRITETYELAAFSPQDVPRDAADEILELINQQLQRTE